jgi:hypothetical protein
MRSISGFVVIHASVDINTMFTWLNIPPPPPFTLHKYMYKYINWKKSSTWTLFVLLDNLCIKMNCNMVPIINKEADQPNATVVLMSESNTPTTMKFNGTLNRLYSAARDSSGTMEDFMLRWWWVGICFKLNGGGRQYKVSLYIYLYQHTHALKYG